MKPSLLPHQIKALERLHETGGKQLLNLYPGAGKTLTTITYLKELNLKNVLIIAPTSILAVWEAEAGKWEAPSVTRFAGSKVQREKIELSGWVAVGYEMFLREAKRFQKVKWDVLILDESQKIKSPTAKVSKAIRLAATAIPRRILLSGTPIVNGWGDVWSQVECVKPGSLYGNWWAFRNTHAIMPIPGVPMISGWRGVETIKAKIAPYVFTIPKEEITKNLPPLQMIDVPVELSPREMKAYAQMRDEMLMQIDGETITAANALVKVARLRQVTNGLFAFGEDISSKAEVLRDLLDTLSGQHVIIFTMYSTTSEYLAKTLKIKFHINGSTVNRDAIIESWKREGGALIGTSAMSTGLNLQQSAFVIQIEPSWTQAEEEQRIGRAWRTGQSKQVTVYNLLAKGTIDYTVRKLIAKKGKIAVELAEIKELL